MGTPAFARTTFASSVALAFAVLAACSRYGVEDGQPLAIDASADALDAFTPLVDAASSLDASTTDADASTVDAAIFDGGACNVRVDAFPIGDSAHVPDGTPVAYSSNPPSSGPHYGTWANFQELTHPVADGHLVHSMEHGAVLVLYDCATPGPACDALVAGLRSVRDAVPTDPLCDPAIRVRVILAPRAANDTAVAAAAWGHTYRADCVDPVSLTAFIVDHYAKAPENFCVPGQVF